MELSGPAFVHMLLFLLGFVLAATSQPQLVQVQVIMRHGSRAPYDEIPNHPAYWNCTLDILEVPVNGNEPEVNINRIYRKNYIKNEETLLGNCAEGELTYAGYLLQLNLGTTLRTKYIDGMGFLDSNYNPQQIYVRSDDIPRTFQSAEAHLLGFFPPESRTEAQIIQINTIDLSKEYMQANNRCPAFMQHCNDVQNTSEWQAVLQQYEPLKQKLQVSWNSSSIPWWIGTFGSIESRDANNVPFPPGVNDNIYQELENISVWQIYQLYSNPQYTQLGIGPFVQELYDNMVDRVSNGILDPRWKLYSAHDTTLAFLLIGFGAWDGTAWPPYAGNILLELYIDDNGDFFVQFLYNGNLMQLPGCAEKMCTWAEFSAIADTLIPDDWEKQCGLQAGASKRRRAPRADWESTDVTAFLC
eukprot:TRINITY_DN1662_c0_g1_i1.p1 TRINITY_DN1662_c0_g1~~TRINITY_DN1662_c0_g1_i1.p1  ORF type:complete len:414 (-),score=73.82 TRINITY_DN1662_c0_g1_i1:50-1291(-)